MMCQYSITPVRVRAASAAAVIMNKVCVMTSSRRRSIRSTITPMPSESTSTGMNEAKVTAPRLSSEPVSW